MKQTLVSVLALVGATAILFGAFLMWRQRPWRTAVSVNGRSLRADELEQRAQTMLDDAKRVEHLLVPKGREKDALRHYAREAAKAWIVKEVMLAEAVRRGYEPTAEDEKDAIRAAESRLTSRKMTLEQFFKEGPLPEEMKRRDFREGILIQKFVASEVRDKISVSSAEIDARQQELKRLAVAQVKPGEKPKMTWDRKRVIDMLRAERFRVGFRKLFRKLYLQADVKSPEFPELEELERVSPPRPEDDADDSSSEGNPGPSGK